MNRTQLQFRSLFAGCLGALVFLVGAAHADDTDVYLKGVGGGGTKADVLIIFDNSGSMNITVPNSGETYNPATTYTGIFLDSKLYWAPDREYPANDATGLSQSFDKANNRCATSLSGLASAGFYANDIIKRWRTTTTPNSWVNLSSTQNNPAHVDCKADYDNSNPSNPGFTNGYPRNTSGGLAGPYVANRGQSNVTWGTTRTTLYTANYLNWYYSPAAQDKTRIQIARDTVVNLLQGTANVRWGLMTFNNNNQEPHGGRVAKAIGEGDAHVTSVIDTVRSLTATTFTPLSETLWEGYRYLAGRSVDYGNATNPTNPPLDPAAQSGGLYLSPFKDSCQKAFIVYMTDGAPTNDVDANSKIPALIGGNCTASPTTGEHGKCLDDLAAYMYNNDIYAGKDGIQSVVTYTIGFTIDHPLLAETARRGGGKYYTANTAAELSSAFQTVIADISATNTSFAAPSLSVNAFNRLFNRDSVYFSLFQPSIRTRWDGNIKKFNLRTCTQEQLDAVPPTCVPGEVIDAGSNSAIDPATSRIRVAACSVWSNCPPNDGPEVKLGGAGSKVQARGDRTLFTYTNNPTPAPNNEDLNVTKHKVEVSNAALTFDMLGLVSSGDAAVDAAARADRINWLRGQDIQDEDEDGITTEDRWKLGDALHSRPLAITYGGTSAAPVIKLFVGSNDGSLRMIDEATGVENWAFIPRELLAPIQQRLFDDTVDKHPIGLDGTPTAWIQDVDGDGKIEPGDGDFVHVFIGMRRGGNNIYALDVTPSSTCTTSSCTVNPKLMWVIKGGVDNTDFAKLAQTWSAPLVTRIRLGQGAEGSKAETVLIFAGGYDPDQDAAWGENEITSGPNAGKAVGSGNAIYIVDPKTGSRIWWASAPGSGADLELANMTYSIPSDIALLDSNGDGETDRLYVGDNGAQLWRIDLGETLKKGNNAGSTGARLAVLADGSVDANKRKFFYPPDIAQVTDSIFSPVAAYDMITIASGDRETPLSVNTVQDQLFAIRDTLIKGKIPLEAGSPNATAPFTTPFVTSNLYDATQNLIQDGTDKDAQIALLRAANGWYVNLSKLEGEKALAASVILSGTVFYTTYVPSTGTNPENPCEPLEGTGYLYAVNLLNAAAVFDETDDGLSKSDRAHKVGSGIPSEYVPVFQETGVTGLVGVAGGATREDPKIKRPRIKTYWYQ